MNFVNICMIDILACVKCLVCHCMSISVESNPYRKIPLLGVAYPVEGIYLFQVLEVHRGWDAFETVEEKKWPSWPYFCIL